MKNSLTVDMVVQVTLIPKPKGRPLVPNDSEWAPGCVSEHIIHCYRGGRYRVDKAIDKLKNTS